MIPRPSVLPILLVLWAGGAQAVEKVNLGDMAVTVWKPKAERYMPDADSKPPVLIFSHGNGGCSQQSSFLMQALADRGYAVFAPNHADARCEATGSPHSMLSAPDLNTPATWDDSAHRNRRDDIADLLKAIEADPGYRRDYDVTRIGLIGHSLGGYTMLGAMGGWPSWKINDPAIKAVLALSPYAQPLMLNGKLSAIHLPVMYQGGTRDTDITPKIDMKDGSYDQTGKPKYLVIFNGAGHYAWTLLNNDFHDEINTYAIAFLDRYVKGEEASPQLTAQGRQVAVIRYDSPEGAKDDAPRITPKKEGATRAMANPNAAPAKGTMRDRGMKGPFSGGGILGGGRF